MAVVVVRAVVFGVGSPIYFVAHILAVSAFFWVYLYQVEKMINGRNRRKEEILLSGTKSSGKLALNSSSSSYSSSSSSSGSFAGSVPFDSISFK